MKRLAGVLIADSTECEGKAGISCTSGGTQDSLTINGGIVEAFGKIWQWEHTNSP